LLPKWHKITAHYQRNYAKWLSVK